MKPILLYSENETTFTSNGLGSLNEAISAIVTEERNGTYELVLTYPVSGKHFADIGYSCIIKCATVPGGEYQLFRIYAISKERNGIVTINAEHISYQLSYIPVDGFTATSVVEALYKMGTEAMAPCPFTFWTDKSTTARYHQEVPENIRARLGGTSGSILDVYGGEYEWDNYTVKLHNHRGQNRNVTLRYGKNITDISQEENISNVYTSIVGYYQDEQSGTVIKTSVIDSQYASAYPFKRVKIVDFSTDYEEAPTVEQLTQKATSYMNNNSFGVPHVNIKVSFVALWQTEEYKDVAPLERVYLCDTVSVNFEKLGIITSAKIVKTQYNVLLDKYDSIDLGEARTNLSSRLAEQETIIQEQIVETKSEMEKAVNHATELLRGGLGGHIVFNTDADGKPQEILIMDTEDISTAEKVWRWNLNGFGHSSHGYDPDPPYGYGTAITMDGQIVANFITTGTLLADRVRAGLLTDEQGNNYWNLTTGEFRLTSGAYIGNQTFAQYAQSVQDQIDGNITSWFYAYAPTTSNAPASTWTTVNDKIAHIGDLFYNSNTGYCYRWQVKSTALDPTSPTLNDFEWVQISDEDIAAAMAAANTAQDTADHKRRVFTVQPTPPYDVGDLWCEGVNGDIKTCMTARASGTFVSTDWSKQNKYTDDTAFTSFRDGTYASFVTNTNNALSTKITTYYQTSAPTTTIVGDLWIDTDNGNELYRWDGSNWVSVQDADIQSALTAASNAQTTADGKIVTFAQSSTPTATDTGDLWIDTGNNNKMYRWSGSAWVALTDTSALNAFVNGAYATFVTNTNNAIDGKITTYYQSTAPSTTIVGDLWIDTANDNELKRWNGSAWVSVRDDGIQAALTAASNAQTTADGKIVTFAQASQPTATDIGDLWIDTDDDNKMYRWSGSSWVALTDVSALNVFVNGAYATFVTNTNNALDTMITTYYQTTAPQAGTTGDLWIDTDDGNKLYRYNGTTWVSVQDSGIQSALTAASNAQTTADGKIVTFAQTSVPTATDIGDLWIDTDDNNKMYRWSGSAWVAYTDTSGIAAYDATLDQAEIFDRLTDSGTIQGIYMDNGQLYINASYIAAGTLADTSGNTSWDLSSGALSSKRFSVQSTNFTLTEAGIITATGATLNGATINSTNSDNYTLNISSGKISFNNDDAFLKYKSVRSYGNNYNVGAILYGADQLSIASGSYSESGTTTQLNGSAINLFTTDNSSRIDLRCDELLMYSNSPPYESLEVNIDARKFRLSMYPQHGNAFIAEPSYLASNDSNAPLLDFDVTLEFNDYVNIPYNFYGDEYGNIYYDIDTVYIASGISVSNVTRKDGVYW